MNKKGFTLVELVAVIALLAIVIVVVSTNGFGAFNNAKETISNEDKKTIVKAVEFLMTEIQYCDEEINAELLKNSSITDFSYINGLTSPTCDSLIEKAKTDDGLKIPLDYLIDNNYVSGSGITKLKDTGVTYTAKFILSTNNKITGIKVQEEKKIANT